MTRERSICRRCHRFRIVDEVRYCPSCADEIAEMKKPKRRAVEQDREQSRDGGNAVTARKTD